MNDDASILDSLAAAGFPAPRIRLRGEIDPEAALRRSGRFRVLGELARGGVGLVLKARDIDLGRDVALKVLREDHFGNAELLQRFLEEAQIGGQLQHPGIVPVYELGVDEQQRPFFAMKLIKGRTLAALLKEERASKRLVEIFERVCRTVAYAHARGVVHRDLKPANVMIGAFGEVLVVDWGFAKVLRRGGVDDERRDSETESVAPEGESVTGSVLGTPAYMPPEQARGRVGSLDTRSDVFSLGAILCELLTGQPPYVGRRDTLLALAAEARLDDARGRLDGCGADGTLVALCHEALSPARRDRPQHAGVVADAVAAHLARVERRAQLAAVGAAEARAAADRVQAEAAQQRRGRRRSIAMAGCVVAAVGLAGATWAWVDGQRRAERERRDGVASRALEEAEALHGAGRLEEAAAAASRATTLGSARAAEVAARIDADRAAAAQRGRDEKLRARLERIRSEWGGRTGWGSTHDAYAELFAEIGAIDASPLRAELLTALDFWLLIRRDRRSRRFEPWEELRRRADAVSQSDWRREVRRAFHERDRAALESIASTADRELDLLGAMLHGLGAHEAAVRLYRRVVAERPGDFRIRFNLAHALTRRRVPRRDEAVRHSIAAIALRPASYAAHKELAENLKAMGRFEEALAAAEDLARIDPAHPGGAFLRKDLLLRLGRMEAAIPGLRAAGDDRASLWLLYWISQETRDLDLRDEVTSRLVECWPDSPASHAVRIETMRRRGHAARAQALANDALGRWPGDGNLNHQLAFAMVERGTPVNRCESLYQQAVPTPTPFGRESFLAAVWSGLWRRAGDHLAAAEAGVRASPACAAAYHRRARSRLRDRVPGALEDYARALELDPDSREIRNDSVAALLRLGRRDEALAVLRPSLASRDARAHGMFVDLCTRRGALDEALAYYREHLESATHYWHLALCLFRSDRDAEAFDVARAGLRAARWAPGLALNLGNALAQRGDHAAAADAFREAVRLRPRLAAAHEALTRAALLLGAAGEAIRHAWILLDVRPQPAATHELLGRALGMRHACTEAVALYEARIDRPRRRSFADGLALGLLARGAEALPAVEYGASVPVAARVHFALGMPVVGEGLPGPPLAELGRFAEAARAYERMPVPRIATRSPRWHAAQAAGLRAVAAEMAELARLDLASDREPADGVEALRFGRYFAAKGEAAAAVRCFAQLPELPREALFSAARAAARAGRAAELRRWLEAAAANVEREEAGRWLVHPDLAAARADAELGGLFDRIRARAATSR